MHSVAATFDPAAFGEEVAAILRQGARFGLTAGSVGRHAIVPALAAQARAAWPAAFREMARARPGGPEEEMALTVQMIEWRSLFAHGAVRP